MTDDKAAQIKKDIEHLHGFGYAQQLFRDMGGFSNFAISFSIISILTGAVILYGHGLNNGGPGMNGIGWPLVTTFTLFVAAAMAELASAIPTAGALYHWASVIGGPRWGWFTAWWNFIGQFTITAGIDYSCATFIAGLLGLDASFGSRDVLVVYAVVLITHGILNHFGIRIVARLNDFSAVYHMAVVGILAVALAFFTRHGPVSQVFDLTTEFNATNPLWYAFLLGLLQAQWTYTGYDASAHVTEETVNPRVRAPWGVFSSVALSGFFGYVMLFFVTWSVRNFAQVAGADVPYIAAIEQALGAGFGRTMLWAVTIAQWFCGLSSVTSNSRLIFAFARDGGMPGSRVFGQISTKWRTPANALWLAVIIAFLAGVYSKTFPVIVSISTIGLYVSYVIPVFLRLRARLQGRWTREHDGPWSLGSWSTPVAVVALIWVGIISVLFVLPADSTTWAENLRLDTLGLLGSLQVLATFFWALVALSLYWFLYMRSRFKGPQAMGTEEELMRIEEKLESESVWREAGMATSRARIDPPPSSPSAD
jgi:amino acid transporter